MENQEKKTSHKFCEISVAKLQIIMNKGVNLRKELRIMRNVLRYLGIIVQIIGVVVLAIPFFGGFESNRSLLIGLLMVIGGFILHIIIRKRNI